MNPARLLTAVILLWPVFVIAGTSANYSLAPDTVDGGGLRGVSASYTLNGSASAGGAGASANYTARTGFAGQLFDAVHAVATGIRLTASPLSLNEGTTLQLGASLLFDDSTSVPLGADSIAWTVHSGPLAGISRSGLASAAGVYQDSAAVARGTWQTFTATLELTVRNLFPDNFETYAGDGIDDAWQVLYFGVNNPLAGPQIDPDSDGWDNRFEYNACLIPTDPLSTFSMMITEVTGGGHAVTFSPRFPGCTYSLMSSSDLSLWAPVSGIITDAGTTRTILDPEGNRERRFYFISVQR